MASILAAPGVERLSSAELRALGQAARRLGVPADWLATIISFESAGSFSPAKLNAAGSGAFGLIQFLPSTASRLLRLPASEATDKGRSMGFAEQLHEMVVPYFSSFGRQFQRLEDLYLAVFWPAAIGKPGATVIATNPAKAYTQNRSLDRGGKGFITADDVTGAVTRVFARASEDPRIVIRSAIWPWIVAVPLGAVAALYLSDRYAASHPSAYRVPNYPALRPVRHALTATEKEVQSWPRKARTWAHSSRSPLPAYWRSATS